MQDLPSRLLLSWRHRHTAALRRWYLQSYGGPRCIHWLYRLHRWSGLHHRWSGWTRYILLPRVRIQINLWFGLHLPCGGVQLQQEERDWEKICCSWTPPEGVVYKPSTHFHTLILKAINTNLSKRWAWVGSFQGHHHSLKEEFVCVTTNPLSHQSINVTNKDSINQSINQSTFNNQWVTIPASCPLMYCCPQRSDSPNDT